MLWNCWRGCWCLIRLRYQWYICLLFIHLCSIKFMGLFFLLYWILCFLNHECWLNLRVHLYRNYFLSGFILKFGAFWVKMIGYKWIKQRICCSFIKKIPSNFLLCLVAPSKKKLSQFIHQFSQTFSMECRIFCCIIDVL